MANFRSRALRHRGTLTLPIAIRRALRLEVGDQLAIDVDAAGRVVLTPLSRVPKSAEWFYAARWRRRITEAEFDLLMGKYLEFGSMDELLRRLGA
jgi:bifunctional DNA-binding transcriptional regulator/antitoxin component of YhaV-PrlF toxin-antitoxin module